ncbi:MAG: single-stranded DNA-binding protein [Parcubacteria group bacterium]|nr:single-stranded DNA-binding protein [Parcubacteria group bacterium]MCR4342486.1 single-stranded DNA-binding protein [Patescibacteria group bacterium]
MNLNKVLLIGNLTRDPELRSLPSGAQVASFSVATNRVWKDQSGQRKDDTQFHNVVVFGKQAEIVAQYLKKGSSALIEGRIQNRSWDGPDGNKRYRTEIVAERVQFGPRRTDGQSSSQGAEKHEESGKNESVDTIEYPEDDINPDEIPF